MNIDKTQIPDEAVEVGAKSRHERLMQTFGRFCGVPWEDLDPDTKAEYMARVRDEVAAAISAWPGATTRDRTVWKDGIDIDVPVDIILPLSKEGRQ